MAKKTVNQSMISDVMAELGRRGGSKQVAKGFSSLTPEQRSAVAKNAAAKRWGTKKKAGKAGGAGKQ